VDIEADREHCSGHGLVSCAVRLTAAGGSGAPLQIGMLIRERCGRPALPLCLCAIASADLASFY
jgi:hypothetical protein